LPQPELQTGWHTPPEQLVLPLALMQACPHAPQSVVVVLVLVSQPLVGSPSQLP
jgi:hypothetical protein